MSDIKGAAATGGQDPPKPNYGRHGEHPRHMFTLRRRYRRRSEDSGARIQGRVAPTPECMTVRVEDPDNGEMCNKVEKLTKLGMLFKVHAQRKGVAESEVGLAFLPRG